MDERTRHRAVGAVVLAIAAAVVLPLVLESSPPGERVASVPAPAESPDSPDPSPDRIRITTFDGVEDERIGSRPKRETEAPAPSADPSGGGVPAAGWAVQIGSFADPDNAEGLRRQVASRGYPVLTQRVTTPEGKPRVRVLVGPDRTRPAADASLSKLQRDSIPGFIVRYPG